jgi:hypothetical protein
MQPYGNVYEYKWMAWMALGGFRSETDGGIG